MLTKKQRELLLFIHGRLSTGEIAPSFDEMKDALDLKSKSGIHRLITALVERGYLERLPHRARALEVKRLPENYSPEQNSTYDETPTAANDAFAAPRAEPIPLYGKIAAGTPIEAIANEGNYVEVPTNMIGNGQHYALTVQGDSMIDAGIHENDIVIIERCESVENGQIAVALVDDSEATLKRIQKKNGKVYLISENELYEPRELDPSRVKIQGKLASLMRTYH